MSTDIALSSLLLQAAAAATAGQQHPAATLYVVATPIGNLADLSLRAIHLLSQVDAVACEDTRVSAVLLQRLGLHKPLIALHDHNELEAAPALIARLACGERVAYVSDAGTPAVSDPGARLVAQVRAAGFRVLPLPGASSVVTALSAAGDAHGSGFRFIGFLPPKAMARRTALRALVDETASVVLFEAPHRIEALADALAEALPGRTVTVCRELTKQFETIHTLRTDDAPAWLALHADHRRGEFVLVLHGLPNRAAADAADGGDAEGAAHRSAPVDAWLRALVDVMPLKQAAALAAEVSGEPRNALYERALAWRREAESGRESDAEGNHRTARSIEESTPPRPVAAPDGSSPTGGITLARSAPAPQRRRPAR